MSSITKNALFEKTVNILESNVPKWLYAEDFSQKETKILTTELLKHFDSNFIIQNRGEVRDAINKYFSDTHDDLIVIFRENQEIIIREKANPDKKKFNRLVLTLIEYMTTDEKNKFIEEKNTAVLKFDESRINSLETHLNLEDKNHFKKVLHESTKRLLHLNVEDQIIYLNNALYVKKGLSTGYEKRLNSFPREEFSKIKDKYFNKDMLPLIKSKLLHILSDTLDFTKIDNQTFLKIYLEIFHDLVYKIVQPILKNEEELVIKYFTNFLLRDYYDEMMIVCATELSKKVTLRDANAEKFLNYYNGEIVSINNRRYIKPIIMSEDGNEYKIFNILSIITRYNTILYKVRNQEKNVKNAKQALENIEKQKVLLGNKQHEYVQSLSKFENMANQTLTSISRRKEHRLKINKQLLSNEELTIIEKKEALENTSIKLNQSIHRYKGNHNKFKKMLITEEKKSLIMKKELEPLNSDYFAIIKALAKTMSQKLELVISVKN